MDVYDFDKTLIRGDSTAQFVLHCLWRYQKALKTLPRTAMAFMRWKRGEATKTDFKDALYKFLPAIPDVNAEVERFWSTHATRIGGPCAPQPGDLIISASPEFLLKGICAQRGWLLLASQVDPLTGNVLGPNCSGAEKVRRFHSAFPDTQVDRFYSDSLNDTPMAQLARKAYLVDIPKGTLTPWPNLN